MLGNIVPTDLIYLFVLLRDTPITFALMSAGAIAFMKFANARDYRIQHCCLLVMFIGVVKAWHSYDYKWLVKHSIFYIDQRHFIFDMTSLVWKGLILREKVGFLYFVFMTLAFAFVSNPLYIVVQLFSNEQELFSGFTSYGTHDPSEYVAGFSGVLFALNFLLTNSASGIAVQHRYIQCCWFELILIHIVVPRTSLINHLCGIFVGYLYTSGGLKQIMDRIMKPVPTIRHNRADDGEILFQNAVIQTLPDVRDYSVEFRRYTGGRSENEQMEIALQRSLAIN